MKHQFIDAFFITSSKKIIHTFTPISSLHTSSTGKVLLSCRLIGNRVQITNCRATVSNTPKVFILVYPLPKAGRMIKAVISQETCLFGY